MPQWAPTHPAMRTAWTVMTADLRVHEAQHEAIGERWKATMVDRLKNLSLSVGSRNDGQRTVQTEFDGWVAEHQAEQSSIDPFTAMLDCTAAAESTAEGSLGQGAAVASGADDGADEAI